MVLDRSQVHIEDVHVGLEIPEEVVRCSSRQLVMWAGASGDFYEIHYDLEYTRSIGLDRLVVHGALKHALLGRLLDDWAGPGGSVARFGCSYRGKDYPNEDLRCRGVVTDVTHRDGQHLAELDVWVESGASDVTTVGTAVVSLPSRQGGEHDGP